MNQPERYPFINKEGKVLWFDSVTTLPELVAAGVTRISFAPRGSPKDSHIYVHATTDDT